MICKEDILQALRRLGIPRGAPVIAHASLSVFGEVEGGAGAVAAALVEAFPSLVMPTFTFKTMLIPEAGPEHNGITYGSGRDLNRMAVYYSPDLPSDRMMGAVPETLRRHPRATRSAHPILSFCGVGVEEILAAQTLAEPLAPLDRLAEQKGWVLLLGVDHTSNTSMHAFERQAGRMQFTRWALTEKGVLECPGYPGCSDGFEAIAPFVESFTRWVRVGEGRIQAVPLEALRAQVWGLLVKDPLALLCARSDCERCDAVRAVRGR